MAKSKPSPNARTNAAVAQFSAAMKKLSAQWGAANVSAKLEAILLAFMEEKVTAAPIPRDTAGLARSRSVVARNENGKAKVRFGFNTEYAAFQDQGDRRGVVTIVPRTKKRLYVPLTKAGRSHHRAGANPEDEGLVRGVDYVLAKEVDISIKPYGSPIGPNHYFSGTIRKHWQWIVKAAGKMLEMEANSAIREKARSNVKAKLGRK